VADRIEETHGLLLYEEDIMVLPNRIRGLRLGEADWLRSHIVRSGGDSTILAELEADFLKQARHHREGESVDGARAHRAFAAAARLAAYAFNKAQAASYGHLAYLSAYLKAHDPVAFACSAVFVFNAASTPL
jgi:DNA polymerase-3 subunit alpha